MGNCCKHIDEKGLIYLPTSLYRQRSTILILKSLGFEYKQDFTAN